MSTLNPEIINSLKNLTLNDGKSLLEEILIIFENEAPKAIQNIKSHFSKTNFEGLKIEAHTLKSTSFNIGAESIGLICHEIETICHTNSGTKKLNSLVEALSPALQETLEAITDYRKTSLKGDGQ